MSQVISYELHIADNIAHPEDVDTFFIDFITADRPFYGFVGLFDEYMGLTVPLKHVLDYCNLKAK